MENIIIKLIEFIESTVNKLIGTEFTFMNIVVGLVVLSLVVIVILVIVAETRKLQYKRLRRKVINSEIQVVTVKKGRKGKDKKTIMTKKALRNPKKNRKVHKRTTKRSKNKGVISVSED